MAHEQEPSDAPPRLPQELPGGRLVLDRGHRSAAELNEKTGGHSAEQGDLAEVKQPHRDGPLLNATNGEEKREHRHAEPEQARSNRAEHQAQEGARPEERAKGRDENQIGSERD